MKKKNPSPETIKTATDGKDSQAGRTGKVPESPKTLEKEVNGYESLGLPEPTRYNDWEVKGRCSDF